MTTCLAAFAFAFAVGLVATVAVRALAARLGVVDRPDDFRKVHGRAVPLLGGVAIYVGFAAPLAALLLLFPQNLLAARLLERDGALAALMAGAALVVAMGVVDDVRGLPARWKLLVQAGAACVAFAFGFAINVVSNPFGEPIALGLLSLPVTVLWFLVCMNAVNLLDGLDGLAAGVCLLAGVTLFTVSLLFGQVVSMLLLACLSGAILGFLLFNFQPASIFLGDSGSMVLGFLLGGVSLLSARKTETAIALLIPCIALGLPIFDTALAVLRRWMRRLPISAADRRHIHHVLLAMGLSQRQAVLALYLACVVLGVAALAVTAGRSEVTLAVLGSLFVVAFVSARLFGGMRLAELWSRLTGELSRRRHTAEAKVSVERAISQMGAVADTDALWREFCRGLEGLGLDSAVLRLHVAGEPEPRVLAWRAPDRRDDEEGDNWSARLKVRANGQIYGRLEVSKAIDRAPMLADAPELLERLRAEMASQMERLVESDAEAAFRTQRVA